MSVASGALIVWAPARADGGGILQRELDRLGTARSAPRRVVARSGAFDVVEIAAASSQDDHGIVWIESDGSSSRTRALLVPADGAAPGAPLLLASETTAHAAGRGTIAIAQLPGGRLRALFPVGAVECASADDEGCVGFGFRELGSRAPVREEPWLSVPRPCPEGAASLAGLDGRFFYAVCSWGQAEPSTMAYAINVETYYARADEVLRGCTPLGMLPLDASTLLLGADCGVLRRAARLSRDMKPPAEFPLADLTLGCERGAPIVRAAGWELPLSAPRDRLEAVLPAAIAPAGARAIYTGRALLVAQRMSDRLELRRYSCSDGILLMQSSSAAAGP